MLTQLFGYSALGCVVASIVVGLSAVWIDSIPKVYLEKTFTTLAILLAGSGIAAIVSHFFVH